MCVAYVQYLFTFYLLACDLHTYEAPIKPLVTSETYLATYLANKATRT